MRLTKLKKGKEINIHPKTEYTTLYTYRTAQFIRSFRMPPNYYDGSIDFYKVRVQDLQPLCPGGDHPKVSKYTEEVEPRG